MQHAHVGLGQSGLVTAQRQLVVVAASNPYKEAQALEALPGGAPNTVVRLEMTSKDGHVSAPNRIVLSSEPNKNHQSIQYVVASERGL